MNMPTAVLSRSVFGVLLLASPALLQSAQAARVTIPATSVTLEVPAGFVAMPKSVIDRLKQVIEPMD